MKGKGKGKERSCTDQKQQRKLDSKGHQKLIMIKKIEERKREKETNNQFFVLFMVCKNDQINERWKIKEKKYVRVHTSTCSVVTIEKEPLTFHFEIVSLTDYKHQGTNKRKQKEGPIDKPFSIN